MSLGVWQPEVKNRNGRQGIRKQSALVRAPAKYTRDPGLSPSPQINKYINRQIKRPTWQ